MQKNALIGVIALVVLIGAFAAGRYTAPESVRTVETVKVVEVEKQVVVVQEKVKVEKVYVQNEAQAIHREEHTTTRPDGTVEVVKTEDINVTKVVTENNTQYVDRIVEKEVVKYEDRIVEKVKLVTMKKPDWMIGAMVGYDFKNLDATKFVSGLHYGAHAERRILGPVFLGAWGMTNRDLGLSLSMEF